MIRLDGNPPSPFILLVGIWMVTGTNHQFPLLPIFFLHFFFLPFLLLSNLT